ncbi:MAG: hypothetical protein ACRCSP_01000 [Rhodoglobus sp.]
MSVRFSEPLAHHQRSGRRRISPVQLVVLACGGLALLAVGATGVWVLTHQQRVADQFTVWQFEPDATLRSYAKRTTMTEEARFLFYASRPSVEPVKSFQKHCASQREDVGILGCYVHLDRKIYLFDVTDKRLDGIEEVVAAHEMLHAAWDRMPEDERKALAPLLEEAAQAQADDPDFVAALEYYEKAEPGERLNELHSIIGTEFLEVNNKLEKHYAQFFSDRVKLVALHTSSDAVFSERQTEIDDILAQITALKTSIDADYAVYNAGYDTLNTAITTFNAQADEGGIFTQQEFDTERAALLARQSDLDALFVAISGRVTQYDELVTQLEAVNAEVADLNKSINIQRRQQGDL